MNLSVNTPTWPALDEDVERAMRKWPNVPQCFGWLALDTRGAWRLQGEVVHHEGLNHFLSRNYRSDAQGRWYVQNGPQQVFVDLSYTPWVYRYLPTQRIVTHTHMEIDDIQGACLDDDGNLLLATAYGVGIVDDRDLLRFEDLFELDLDDQPRALKWRNSVVALRTLPRIEVAKRFAFDPLPR
jgi:hypothetical protein